MSDVMICCFGFGQEQVNGGRTCAKSTAEYFSCPIKNSCLRYKAKPSTGHYFVGLPYKKSEMACSKFLPIKESDGSDAIKHN